MYVKVDLAKPELGLFHKMDNGYSLLECKGVPRRQPHRRSGLATLPSVEAVP